MNYNKNNTHNHSAGFTIVELMFAIIFIAFILLFTTISVMQIVQQYNRGIETKAISQAGRSIVDMMARDIARSNAVSIYGSETGVGMLCTSTSAYAWNGINAPADHNQRNRYLSAPSERLSLVRTKPGECITSTSASPCEPRSAGCSDKLTRPNIGSVAESVELLSPQVQVMSIRLVPIASGGKLSRLYVTLGTSRSDAFVDDGGIKVCRVDNQTCAKSEFSTTVYMP